MTHDEARRMALLEATLREILRIDTVARSDTRSVPIDDALDGRLGREWRAIVRKARGLVSTG